MSASHIQSLMPCRQTEIDLLAWLGQAADGDILEYHRGFLALDRSSCGDPTGEHDRIALGVLAFVPHTALAERELVLRVHQRRRGAPLHAVDAARPERAAAGDLLILARGHRLSDFARWSVAQVGRYFNVDRVVHVELYEFRLKDSPGGNVFHGYAESTVCVVSPETGKQVWPVLASARLVTAETMPDVQPEESAEVATILSEGLADKIARHFYTYKRDDLPMRPKVR